MLTVPIQLSHSWPIFDRNRQFELGCEFAVNGAPFAIAPGDASALAGRGIGMWDCDLADNRLTWSNPVYELFGLPRGAAVSRDETVALYDEGSRAIMERLRAYAIRHGRGFTLDAEIVPASGERRRMRLMASPIQVDGRTVRLQGLKRLLMD